MGNSVTGFRAGCYPCPVLPQLAPFSFLPVLNAWALGAQCLSYALSAVEVYVPADYTLDYVSASAAHVTR